MDCKIIVIIVLACIIGVLVTLGIFDYVRRRCQAQAQQEIHAHLEDGDSLERLAGPKVDYGARQTSIRGQAPANGAIIFDAEK